MKELAVNQEEIKELTALVGQLSMSIYAGKMVLNVELRLFHSTFNFL